MPDLDEFVGVLKQQRVVVFTTYRRDGMPQMSLVSAGRFQDGLAFTTRQPSAKYHNLMRDRRCAMMLVRPGMRGYAVLDGEADVRSSDNTGAEQLRLDLRAVYEAARGEDHPDWAEYDRVMVEQKRAVVLLVPGRVFNNLG